MLEATEIRKRIMDAGVKNLKEFGYQDVTRENLMSDYVYRKFFRSMLEDNIGKVRAADPVIRELMSEADALGDSGL